jgi:coproporphyrinogen III oxidase-like Fe-S oxidoreductase
LFLEEVLLGLRTARGIDIDSLRLKYGETAVIDEVAVEDLLASGHLNRTENHIQPSISGMAVADSLVRTITNRRRRGPVR